MHGSGLDIGPYCPNGSTQKCVMPLIAALSVAVGDLATKRLDGIQDSRRCDQCQSINLYKAGPDQADRVRLSESVRPRRDA